MGKKIQLHGSLSFALSPLHPLHLPSSILSYPLNHPLESSRAIEGASISQSELTQQSPISSPLLFHPSTSFKTSSATPSRVDTQGKSSSNSRKRPASSSPQLEILQSQLPVEGAAVADSSASASTEPSNLNPTTTTLGRKGSKRLQKSKLSDQREESATQLESIQTDQPPPLPIASVAEPSSPISSSISNSASANLHSLLFNSTDNSTGLSSLFNPPSNQTTDSNFQSLRRSSFTPTGVPTGTVPYHYPPPPRPSSASGSSVISSLDEESLKQHNKEQEELQAREDSKSISPPSAIQEDPTEPSPQQSIEQNQEEEEQVEKKPRQNWYQPEHSPQTPNPNPFASHSRQPSSSTSQTSSTPYSRGYQASGDQRSERFANNQHHHYQRKEASSHRMVS